MTTEEAIRHIHATLDACNQAGFVVTGRLEFVRPRDASYCRRNTVNASIGTHDDGCGSVEVGNMSLTVEPVRQSNGNGKPTMTRQEAETVVAAHEPKSLYGLNRGELCIDCGSPNLVTNGSCLKCLDCGSTNGCS